MAKSHNPIRGKTVLITGGTGSFGQAMTRKLLDQYEPATVRVFSRDELKQHDMRIAFKNDERLRFLIGDVRDPMRLKRATEGVDLLFHAAALKQVPACEYNPIEAIRTNVDGAINVIEACLDNSVERVIALSTDKSVNPINLYGATKLCSDKLFIQANSYTGARPTRFSVVRYGNVMASRGSVIPIFREQLAKGKSVTITDERMTRFWITLDQATDFVLDSLDLMRGGEIFVPKIPSMKIVELAKAIDPNCEFSVTGIRPGEKLHEFLLSPEEGRRAVELDDRYLIEPEYHWWRPSEEHKHRHVAPGFSYSSDTNPQWLDREAMRRMLKADLH